MANRRTLVCGLAAAAVALMMSVASASNRLTPLGTLESPCGEPAHFAGPTALSISPDGSHVYATDDFVGVVYAFARDAGSGDLAVIHALDAGDDPSVDISGPRASLVTPDGAHLYLADWIRSRIYVFARNSLTGALTFVAQVTDGQGGVDGLDEAWRLALSGDGAHLYVAGKRDDEVAVFGRDGGTGLLTFVEVQQDGVGGVSDLEDPKDVAVSPDGEHLYVTVEAAVLAFARDVGTGALTFIEAEPHTPSGPDRVLLSPDGLFVYTSTQGGIRVFSRNPTTGELAPVQALTSGFSGDLVQLDISPDGAYLYAANPIADTVYAVSRDATLGTVAIAQTLTGFEGRRGIGEMRVSPDGDHVYALSTEDDGVVVFARDGGTGFLTPSSVIFEPRDSVAVRMSPDGTSVYTVCDRAIGVASRDPVTGALTLVDQVRFPEALGLLTDLALSPDGTSAYVPQAIFPPSLTSDVLHVFDRDTGNGLLTPVEQHVDDVGGVTGLQAPRAVALAPDGESVYVTSETGILTFDRDVPTGTLAFLELFQPPIASPLDVVVTSDGGSVYASSHSIELDIGQIAQMDRDPGTGLLTYVAQIVGGGGSAAAGIAYPLALAVAPDDAHLYVRSARDDAVTTFSRDGLTGALTFVQTAPAFANGGTAFDDATGLHADASGAYVYAANFSFPAEDQLTVFRRDPGSGALSFVERRGAVSSGEPSLDDVVDVDGSPEGRHVYALADDVVVIYGHTAACSAAPAAGCVAAGTATLKLKTDVVTTKNRLTWKWNGIGPLAAGDPLATTSAAVCIYDASGSPVPLVDAAVPAGGTCGGTKPCWKVITPGFKYRDSEKTPDGIVSVKLHVGGTDVKVVVKGKEGALPPFALPLTDPVTVQLQLSNGTCVQAVYTGAAVNDGIKYTAKIP